MNKQKIDSEFYVQISEKNKDCTCATIIKNDGMVEVFGKFFPNDTPVTEIKNWAEGKINLYKKNEL
jgi:HSP90 family molecular chaperone